MLKTSDFFVLLLLIKMVFSYEDKVIIKYIRTKFGHGARRIVTDHPEYDWNENGVKALLKSKKINHLFLTHRKFQFLN